MKVAVATDGLYPLVTDDGARFCRFLVEQLARTGEVELTVLHPHPLGVFDPGTAKEVHVPIAGNGAMDLVERWRYSARMGEALAAVQPDAVLSMGLCVWKGMGRFSDRLVVHPHGLVLFQGPKHAGWWLNGPQRQAMRHVVRNSRAVVSLGGKLTALLQGIAEGSHCAVAVIPYAVDIPDNDLVTGAASPVAEGSAQRPLELFVPGAHGANLLGRVAQRLVAEGRQGLARFSCAGNGADLPAATANLRMLGPMEDDRPAARDCDAVFLPGNAVGMPLAALRALAHAKPVFIANTGAASELVNMHNGYLLPLDDDEAWYQAVLAFAERRPETRLKMGRYSLDRTRELFSGQVVARKFVELFRGIAQP